MDQQFMLCPDLAIVLNGRPIPNGYCIDGSTLYRNGVAAGHVDYYKLKWQGYEVCYRPVAGGPLERDENGLLRDLTTATQKKTEGPA